MHETIQNTSTMIKTNWLSIAIIGTVLIRSHRCCIQYIYTIFIYINDNIYKKKWFYNNNIIANEMV